MILEQALAPLDQKAAYFHSCGKGFHFAFQFFQQLLFIIAIKQVEGVEGNDPAIGMDDVDARLFD